MEGNYTGGCSSGGFYMWRPGFVPGTVAENFLLLLIVLLLLLLTTSNDDNLSSGA